MNKYLVYIRETPSGARSHMYAKNALELMLINNTLPAHLHICEIVEVETLDTFDTVADVIMDRRH